MYARFLDMPFYKTGRVKKAPIGEADVQIVLDLLTETGATHLFVAGDHRDTPSTQGALVSGRRAAQAVLARLGAA